MEKTPKPRKPRKNNKSVADRARTRTAASIPQPEIFTSAPVIFPDAKPHKYIICGIQGGGKTQYTRNLINYYQWRTAVYTPNKYEFENEGDNWLLFEGLDYSKDIERACRVSIDLAKRGEIDAVFFPEFDMLYSGINAAFGREMTDLILNHRHYGVAVLVNTRRPQDIPTKLFESSKFVASFAINGVNATRKWNDLHKGMGDIVASLNPAEYMFILKEIGYNPILCRAPFDLSDARPKPAPIDEKEGAEI